MQAIRNKFTGKNKRSSKQLVAEQPSSVNLAPEPLTPAPSMPGAVVTNFSESHTDLASGTHVDHFEKTEIVNDAPVMMATAMPVAVITEFPTESMRSTEILPVEYIERPAVIHESIRQEQVEEIQPIVRVEREKTEIRQITQPLTDREIRPVIIEERTLAAEILPTIINESIAVPRMMDLSTREFDPTLRQVIEKAPIVQETEMWRVIEEVQPVIYREVVVPHVIRTSRPMREVIVEAPIFAEQVLTSRDLTMEERMRWSSLFTKENMIAREVIAEPVAEPIVEPIAPVVVAPVVAPVMPLKKEIVEEIITTTTTTTVAPIIEAAPQRGRAAKGTSSNKLSTSSNNLNSSIAPASRETHDVQFGPNGEKIVRDTVTTTTSSTVMPTRAN